MAKKKPAGTQPRIFKATLSPGGDVTKGAEIKETDAVALRKVGENVVVCGDDLAKNRALAQKVEQTANGK